MKTRSNLLLGLAGLGFVLAVPAQAASAMDTDLLRAELRINTLAPEYREGGFIVARHDDGDDSRYEPRRNPRDEPRAKGTAKHQTREVERASGSQDYGYGYERRQHEHPPQEGDQRGRR